MRSTYNRLAWSEINQLPNYPCVFIINDKYVGKALKLRSTILSILRGNPKENIDNGKYSIPISENVYRCIQQDATPVEFSIRNWRSREYEAINTKLVILARFLNITKQGEEQA